MKIVWLSADKFGYELLQTALMYITINTIICLKENSKNKPYYYVPAKSRWEKGFRVEHGWDDYIEKMANITLLEIDNINDEFETLKEINPDLIVMIGWRQIIGKDILDYFKDKIIGFHPTLLPYGRGPAPIINTIKKGIKNTGVTMFYVSEKTDEGDIIDQERFNLEDTDNAEMFYNKMIDAGEKLVDRNFPLIEKGELNRIKQDESKAITFEKPSLKDNRIDLENESIDDIYRKVKALSKPYNGAYILKDGKRLIIWEAELRDDTSI